MKFIKFAVMAAAALSFSSAYAFHEGGVAYCDGCHSMHNSAFNKYMSGGRNKTLAAWNTAGLASTTQFQGNAYLLQGSDDSSTCLNCHAAPDAAPSGYHVMTFPPPAVGGAGPVERTPGGDFAWLTMTFPQAGYSDRSYGQRHGHNIVAQDYGLVADSEYTVGPGGTFDATKLSCASCHDPHSRVRIDSTGAMVYSQLGTKVAPTVASGSYGAVPLAGEAVGVYRLLAGSNYSQMSYPGEPAFSANPPVAVAPSTYNRSEGLTDTRVAYGSGISEWCANCHNSIHNNNTNSANTALIHPAGDGALLTAQANDLQGNALGTQIYKIYNAYVFSGNLTGAQTSSYNSLVPYEEGTGSTIATLAPHADITGTVTAGPNGGNEAVMCLSCHRAHASGFNFMSRWNNASEFLTVDQDWPDYATATGDSFKNSNGMVKAEYKAAMYDRDATNTAKWASFQRSLCNKCHAKD